MNPAEGGLTTLELGLLGWPLVVGLLVLATHVPLGRRVLARGILFLDLAVAQIAVLGVIAAHTFDLASSDGVTQLVAAGAALVGALLLAECERRWPHTQEAVIGSAFVVAASLGTLLLAGDPHGGEHMTALLTGQILWATPTQAGWLALLTLLLLVVWRWRGERLGARGFYAVFALAITASVQLIGVYLVFASLILPALATRTWPVRQRNWAAAALGTLGYGAGLAISARLDWPAGPAIVVMLAAMSALAVSGRWVALWDAGR